MYILTISGHQRDAASALLKDGRIIAAIEEEKLVRVKHIGISQCGGLPYEAIGYCLESAGVGFEDIDYVTYYAKPRRLLNRQSKFQEQFIPENSAMAEDHKAASVNEYQDRLKTLHLIRRLSGQRSRVLSVDRQLAHAASSFYLSGFDRAAILVLNGKGDYITIASGIGAGRKISLLRRVEFPHSLGWVYSLVSEYLGFRANGGEHNTQWLSLAGEPEFLPAFQDLLKIDAAGIPAIDLSYFTSSLQGADPFSEKFYHRFGDCLRRKDQRFNGGVKSPSWTEMIEKLDGRQKAVLPETNYRRNLAHSLQRHLENTVLALAENVRHEYGVYELCLASRVTSNSLLVSRLERES